MRLVSIDPGIRGCGVAVWLLSDHEPLTWAGYVANPIQTGNDIRAVIACAKAVYEAVCQVTYFADVSEIVFEWPRVYTRDKSKGDPNDLLPLAAVGSALCAFFPRAQHTSEFPYQWKGQVPKGEMFEARVMDRLNTNEKHAIDSKVPRSLRHNVMDAIGIGLHHLGRFERKRIFPGASP